MKLRSNILKEMSSRGLGTLTSDINIDELRKILRDDFNFLPNWVKLVDPAYDYDFCGINDSGKTFYRGGRRYYRPIGWKRFALKVAGQYGNDDWLAADNSGWIVAYHGTEEVNCNPITANGFAISSHGAYGPGVYVSPLIDFASAYARPVTLTNGLKVVVVLQNRIKPGSFSEHHVAGKPCPKYMCKPPCAEQFPYFKGNVIKLKSTSFLRRL